MADYISGVDVSKWNTVDSWAEAYADGQRFMFAKSSEGRTGVDQICANHLLSAEAAGLKTGIYHFARPDNNHGEEEAEHVIKLINGLPDFDLPVALDFEKYSPNDEDDNVPWIRDWVEAIQDVTGKPPIIYTGANVWKYEVGNSDVFTHLPLWQASYSRHAVRPRVTPWPRWTIWQWSGGGRYCYRRVPGFRGAVDLNRFNGTEDDLAALCGQHNQQPPADPAAHSFAQLPVFDMYVDPTESDVARILQGLLTAQGWYRGKIDGLAGPMTRRALIDAKMDWQLPDNLVVDEPTWWALVGAGITD